MALYLGLMSGTSMDAIDAALVKIEEGKSQLVSFLEHPVANDLKQQIRAIDGNTSLATVARMDAVLGELFAETALNLISEVGLSNKDITAIGSHGQTVLHVPEGYPPHSLQIGDPNIITARTGITTVADFRRMDIAFGGQGAPLASLFHAEQFRTKHKRVVLNIGGFANITIIPASKEEDVFGFDTGPGNALMDDWIASVQKKPYDDCGLWAASGRTSEELLACLLDTEYFSAPIPKSTGRDDFNLAWLRSKLDKTSANSPEDIQATLLALTIETISRAISEHAHDARDLIVCGGGAYNGHLMTMLKKRLPNLEVYSSSELGIEPSTVEAICFAWLAYRRIKGLPGNLPNVTSAKQECLLGGIYQA